MNDQQRTELEAAAFRRLLQHLDEHKEVQNIELMLVADFCRNCLSKWLGEEAGKRDLSLSDDDAREWVYGMPYSRWKSEFQQPATAEQLAAFEAKQQAKQGK
ncbi:DUF1244 domain-containing protein [Pokkaliibacter sp. MBI-7]|uniref:DUF1244 domain-containing protein n=1 Tax=Pokkaliibacter sp. MBI-7 TaxID=3040600 RepID=UPI00244AB3C9|nr:DUF1244 domain-containing protein [Pokkaliibacter sp. MBI-7]MDH2433378.1 DUF1244 domain-containing protein [Pokkaliibacter sp. MBI-7]